MTNEATTYELISVPSRCSLGLPSSHRIPRVCRGRDTREELEMPTRCENLRRHSSFKRGVFQFLITTSPPTHADALDPSQEGALSHCLVALLSFSLNYDFSFRSFNGTLHLTTYLHQIARSSSSLNPNLLLAPFSVDYRLYLSSSPGRLISTFETTKHGSR